MRVYILTHPDPSKSGPVAGVDFSRGMGSTVSRRDAYALATLCGCAVEVVDREAREHFLVRLWEEQDKDTRQTVVKEELTAVKAAEPETESKAAGAGDPAPAVSPPQEAAQEAQPAKPKPKRQPAPRTGARARKTVPVKV